MVQANKTKLKFIKKKGYDFVFEELESKKEVILKIFKDKDFANTIKVGDIGYGLVNTNWLNEWQKLELEDEWEQEVLNQMDNKKPTISPYDDKSDKILAQSTLAQSVQITMFILKDTDIMAEEIDVFNEIKEVHKKLFKYMKNEDYK